MVEWPHGVFWVVYDSTFFFFPNLYLVVAQWCLSNNLFFISQNECKEYSLQVKFFIARSSLQDHLAQIGPAGLTVQMNYKLPFTPFCLQLFYLMQSGLVNVMWVNILGSKRFSLSLPDRSPGHSQPLNNRLDIWFYSCLVIFTWWC